MGGVPGVRPARVLVLGAGTVGTQAALMAAGMGADGGSESAIRLGYAD